MNKKRLLTVMGGSVKPPPWYLSGSIPTANCIAAYRATGVADIASSYVNLANPGTYNLTNDGNQITWDANGWKGRLTYFLSTGITNAVAGTWSILVKFSNASALTEFLFGSVESSKFWFINPVYTGDVIRYGLIGATKNVATSITSGVFGICGQQPYRNGVPDGTAFSGTPVTLSQVYLLGGYQNTATFIGYVQAAAIYDITLTTTQAAAVTTSMSAF